MTDSVHFSTLQATAIHENLALFQDFVQTKAKDISMPPPQLLKLDLVVEELIVNILSYAYPDEPGTIEIQCRYETNHPVPRFCVRVIDFGKAFNPLSQQTPDLELNLEDRPIGGLGIFLAETVTDIIEYERTDNSNNLTFCLNLQQS